MQRQWRSSVYQKELFTGFVKFPTFFLLLFLICLQSLNMPVTWSSNWRIVERCLFRRKWSTWEHEVKNWRTWAKSLNRTLLITFHFYCNLPLVCSLFYLLLEFSIIFFFRELQIFFSTEKVSLKVFVIYSRKLTLK